MTRIPRMSRLRGAGPLIVCLAVALTSCGEPSRSTPASPVGVETSFAKTSSSCDASNLLSLARSYFSTPQQQTTTDTLKAMQTECGTGQSGNVVAGGWTVLSAIDTISAAGTGGSADGGASLANGVIQYMCQNGTSALCAPAPAPTDVVAPVIAADLGSQGMFAVRGTGTGDIVAHGKVQFDGGNTAFWGVQVGDRVDPTAPPGITWADATGASTILIYGHPDTLPQLSDASIGNLAYRLHTFPRVPGFTDGEVGVGVCYLIALDLSGDANVLQRNGTLLQIYEPSFCADDPRMASTGVRGALEGLLAAAGRALLPQPLLAATSVSNPPATGGSPVDFSHFAPVAANPAGRLEFLVPPQTDGVDGTALDSITVAALSGGGTEIERVTVQLYLSTNNGLPAGADFCDTTSCPPPTEVTQEIATGYHTVATFKGVTIYKPGGYQLCATANTPVATPDAASITFQDVCATIHIKNNN